MEALKSPATGSGITDISHFFAGDAYVGFLNVRPVACLNCSGCCNGNFTAANCENRRSCGEVERPPVLLKSGAREDTAQTRYSVTENGKKVAMAVRDGEIVGAECANETEPYILFKALGVAYEVTEDEYAKKTGEYKHNWMGEVKPGDWVIKGLKFDRRAGDLYSDTEKIFCLFIEDTRGVVNATPLARKISARNREKSTESVIYDVDGKSLDAVKKLVYLPEPFQQKRPRVPR